MILRIVSGIILTILSFGAFGQSDQVALDSIHTLLRRIDNVDKRFEKCQELALDEQNREQRLAILHLLDPKDFDLADSLHAAHLSELAIIHLRLNNHDSSHYYVEQVEGFANTNNLPFFLIRNLNVRAHSNSIRGNLDSSVFYYKQALEAIEPFQPERAETKADLLGNLGGVFFNMGDFETSRQYINRSLEIGDAHQLEESAVYNLIRLAMIERNVGNADKALQHNLEAVEKLKVVKDSSLLLYNYINIGRIYRSKEDLDNAMAYFDKARILSEKIADSPNYMDILNESAIIHIKKREFNLAQQKAQEMLNMAEREKQAGPKGDALKRLYEVEQARGNYREALQYRNENIAMKDSIAGLKTKKTIAELQTQYETAMKDAEIERISFENKMAEAEIAQTRSTLFFVIISASLGIGLIVMIFYFRVQKERAEKLARVQQLEALQKRIVELHGGPKSLHIELSREEINTKLHTPLTEREFDSLKLGLDGKSNKEIAEELFVSLSTVKFHLNNVYTKLGVNNRKEALEFVVRST